MVACATIARPWRANATPNTPIPVTDMDDMGLSSGLKLGSDRARLGWERAKNARRSDAAWLCCYALRRSAARYASAYRKHHAS